MQQLQQTHAPEPCQTDSSDLPRHTRTRQHYTSAPLYDSGRSPRCPHRAVEHSPQAELCCLVAQAQSSAPGLCTKAVPPHISKQRDPRARRGACASHGARAGGQGALPVGEPTSRRTPNRPQQTANHLLLLRSPLRKPPCSFFLFRHPPLLQVLAQLLQLVLRTLLVLQLWQPLALDASGQAAPGPWAPQLQPGPSTACQAPLGTLNGS